MRFEFYINGSDVEINLQITMKFRLYRLRPENDRGDIGRGIWYFGRTSEEVFDISVGLSGERQHEMWVK